MRWNQLADDLPRATALADILCGAATADGHFDPSEHVVVDAMIMKVLGVGVLPESVHAHVRAFDPTRFDLMTALDTLALKTERDKKALLQVVTDIVHADERVSESERNFVTRLGLLLI